MHIPRIMTALVVAVACAVQPAIARAQQFQMAVSALEIEESAAGEMQDPPLSQVLFPILTMYQLYLLSGLASASEKNSFLAAQVGVLVGLGVFLRETTNVLQPTDESSENSPLAKMAAVGQLSFARYGLGNNFGSFTVSSYMGGLRYWLPPQPRFQPYVQGLAGIERSFQESTTAVGVAGGVIFPVNNWNVTAEAGFRRAFYEFAGETTIHIQGGLTIPIGSR